jgi:hypothetical protein
MMDYRKAAALCALAVTALGGGAAHAAPAEHPGHAAGPYTTTLPELPAVPEEARAAENLAVPEEAPPGESREVDRNLVKPPPGGVLAPVTDAADRIIPGN